MVSNKKYGDRMFAVAVFILCLAVASKITLAMSSVQSPSHSNDVQSHFTTTIKRRNMAVVKLKEQFKVLFKSTVQVSRNADDILMYKCDDNCANKQQFHHGVVTGFMIALVSKRRFVVNGHTQCSVFSLYEPGLYEWNSFNVSKLIGEQLQFVINSPSHRLHDTEVFTVSRDMMTLNMTEAYKNRVLYLSENHDWLNQLRENEFILRNFPWFASTTINDIIRLVYTGLFNVPVTWTEAVQKSLTGQLRSQDKLMCFFGNMDKPMSNTSSLVELLTFYKDGYMHYIRTAEKDKAELAEQVPIRQVSLADVNSLTPDNCQAEFDFILTVEVASLCDVLITTNNVAGIVGATVRPTSRDLYCVSHTGAVYSCSRTLITQSFRDNLEVKLKLNYIIRKYGHL